MNKLAVVFPKEQIVVSLIRHFSWTHFIALIPRKNPLQREFYTEMCRMEGWSVRTLRKNINSMLFERTAISRKPELSGLEIDVSSTNQEPIQKTVKETVDKILTSIRNNPKVIVKELVEITGLSRRGVEWNIKKLKEEGKIKHVEPTKGGHWEVTDEK